MEFPRFVYRKSENKLVNDAEEFTSAINGGWFATVPEAIEGKSSSIHAQVEGSPVEAEIPPDEEYSPPTREELEAKALELGVRFDGRTTDEKLAKRIAELIG